MTPINLSRWLGACALGSLLVLGCRHSRKCDVVCYPCCEHIQPVPADPPKKVSVEQLPPIEQAAAKKDERPNVTYRVVAPGMPGYGDIVGTEEMTAADAEKVHIRPGHTPGALWVPVSHHAQPPMLAGEKKAEPAEASETPPAAPKASESPAVPKVSEENPSMPKMVVPQKPEESDQVPELPQ